MARSLEATTVDIEEALSHSYDELARRRYALLKVTEASKRS